MHGQEDRQRAKKLSLRNAVLVDVIDTLQRHLNDYRVKDDSFRELQAAQDELFEAKAQIFELNKQLEERQ